MRTKRSPAIMKRMFFRREQPKNPTFADRIESLRKAGFTTTPRTGGAVRASRGDCAVERFGRGGKT